MISVFSFVSPECRGRSVDQTIVRGSVEPNLFRLSLIRSGTVQVPFYDFFTIGANNDFAASPRQD